MKILITGGAGFIGSALIRYIISVTQHSVINFDALTYAGDLKTVESISSSQRYAFVRADIRDKDAVKKAFDDFQPDAVIHLAAESHVDRSIESAADFITTNINGTHILLEAALNYFNSLSESGKSTFRFIHVSTDEVYGSLGFDDAPFTEKTPYRPNSPYSACKASSDHLARAWNHTHGLPVIITHCSNNYGPFQFPEKLIPVIIKNALAEKPLPVYGEGKNIRDWIFVDDHVRAMLTVLEKGTVGETYNIGGNAEIANIDLVKMICGLLDNITPLAGGKKYEDLISFVTDRKGHDLRYAIDNTFIKNTLQWQPSVSITDGLRKTIEWYINNPQWLNR